MKNVLDPDKNSSALNVWSISLILSKSLLIKLYFSFFSTGLSGIILELLLSFSAPEESYPVLVPRIFLSLNIKKTAITPKIKISK